MKSHWLDFKAHRVYVTLMQTWASTECLLLNCKGLLLKYVRRKFVVNLKPASKVAHFSVECDMGHLSILMWI